MKQAASQDHPIDEIMEYIDWTPFFQVSRPGVSRLEDMFAWPCRPSRTNSVLGRCTNFAASTPTATTLTSSRQHSTPT